jgi:hypothetical protein
MRLKQRWGGEGVRESGEDFCSRVFNDDILNSEKGDKSNSVDNVDTSCFTVSALTWSY